MVDGGVVDRNEAVGCQEIQKLIQEVVRVVANELKEIVEIFVIKMVDMALDGLLFRYNVASFTPEPPDPEPGTTRKAAAIKDVLEVKQFTFIEPDSSDFDVLSDDVVAHDGWERSCVCICSNFD